jgi:hypothetical protein
VSDIFFAITGTKRPVSATRRNLIARPRRSRRFNADMTAKSRIYEASYDESVSLA